MYRTPARPVLLRNIPTGDITGLWDLSITDDRMYVAGLGGVFGDGATYMYDISNVRSARPQLLGKINSGSKHASASATADGEFLNTSQREVGSGISVWNISSPAFPALVGTADASTYGISSYSAGSVEVSNQVIYAAWYEAGAQVLDIDDLNLNGVPGRIGVHETSDASPLAGFVGNRSIYPGLGPTTVLLSDTQHGLFIVDATNVLPPSASGDFNADGAFTIADIDALTAEIIAGSNSSAFNMNGDGVVDGADLTSWLSLAGQANIGRPYQSGDANLDGQVNPSDLNAMALNWQQSVGLWSEGDFTADGFVDAADLNVLGVNWASAAPLAAPVPEPNGVWVAFLAIGLLATRRRLGTNRPYDAL